MFSLDKNSLNSRPKLREKRRITDWHWLNARLAFTNPVWSEFMYSCTDTLRHFTFVQAIVIVSETYTQKIFLSTLKTFVNACDL